MADFVLADRGFEHMTGWGWGMGMGLLGLLLLLLVVGLVVWLVVTSAHRNGTDGRSSRSAVDVLDDRYARGEIDRKDYLERRADLEDRH